MPSPESIKKQVEKVQKNKEKYLVSHEEKLAKIRSLCPHKYEFVDGYDSWNGWDYPTITKFTTVYQCAYCNHIKKTVNEVGHGMTVPRAK